MGNIKLGHTAKYKAWASWRVTQLQLKTKTGISREIATLYIYIYIYIYIAKCLQIASVGLRFAAQT
jgi:hypothetical protein